MLYFAVRSCISSNGIPNYLTVAMNALRLMLTRLVIQNYEFDNMLHESNLAFKLRNLNFWVSEMRLHNMVLFFLRKWNIGKCYI